jgi:hypothetical protein
MEYLIDSEESRYFKSQEFKEKIQASIDRETWDKGLPKYYKNDDGEIVEHFKDGTINVMKNLTDI